MIVSELFTVYGSGTGTGAMSLQSDIFYGTVQHIRIPKGAKLKVWAKRITGDAAGDIEIQFTHDVTAGTPTWTTLSKTKLTAAGELDLTLSKRPIKVMGFTGNEAVRVYVSSGTGNYTAELDVEIVVGE